MKKSLLAAVLIVGCSSQPPQPPKKPVPPPVRRSPAVVSVTVRTPPKHTPGPRSSVTPSTSTPPLKNDDHLAAIVPPFPPVQLSVPHPPQTRGANPSTAADWRAYAEKCLSEQHFEQASHAFTQEALIYRKTDPQAARVEELKAARYKSDLTVYQRAPVQTKPKERLEPAAGCYVGAFIDRDDRLSSHQFGSQTFGDIAHFNSLTEKKHASFFTYLRYGNPFPRDWANYVKQNDAICHLAWEPDSLDQIQDDDYLRRFIADLKAYDHPVILRFAGEMNGEWTPYHKDPQRYKEAFRLVHRLTRECPKVATMWCPNSVPADNVAAYYPGDDGCDWVGVNLYSVLYIDNDPKTPGDWINPIDLLEPVYRAYAAKKPIAIGEYAASHRAACVPKENVPFAQLKLAQLYSSLPLKYPRVKMVNWFDCNNLVKARAGRQLNNYQLTDSSHLLGTYESQVNNGYFLARQEQPTWQATPLPSQKNLDPGEELKLHFFARSYVPDPIIYLKLDGKWRWRGQLPQPPSCNLGKLTKGNHKLEIILADLRGNQILTQNFKINAH